MKPLDPHLTILMILTRLLNELSKNSDCGDWNKFYMSCDAGRCVCSKHFADFDGNRFNGCESIAKGSEMRASNCPVIKEVIQPKAMVKINNFK